MPFSCDTILELSMTLMRLSGAKSLRNPLVSQSAHNSLVSGRPHPLLLRPVGTRPPTLPNFPSSATNKEAVKQYASVPFPAPESIGLLMDLNVPKSGFRHLSEFMTRWAVA